MILKGTLMVKITEREGKPLKSGLLDCELGQFQVRYAQLETLDEGQYKVFFSLVQIQQSCYSENGQYCFALEAVVDEMTLQHTSIVLPQRKRKSSAAVSPVETPNQMCLGIEADSDTEETIAVETDTEVESKAEVDVEVNDAALFGELWPLPEEFKLDSTVHRDVLKAQIHRLSELDYRFLGSKQIWFKFKEEQHHG